MKKSIKRILSMILMACLMLTVVVPSVLAAEAAQTITFGTGSSSNQIAFYNDGSEPVSDDFTSKVANTAFEIMGKDWTYLNQSNPDCAITVAKNYTTVQFVANDYTIGSWAAVSVNIKEAGTYDMTFQLSGASLGGLTMVYVMSKDVYKNAIKNCTFGTSAEDALTQTQNEDIYKALDGNTLAEGVLNSNKNRTVEAYQSIGSATFEKNGEYVLLFRCFGKPEEADKSTAYRLVLLDLTMTPVVASVGNEAYTDAASAIAAIGNATADDAVAIYGDLQLSSALTTSAAITVNEGAVLDLNGNALTAKAVTCNGTGIVKDSQDGKGTMTVANAKLNTASQLPLTDAGAYRFFNTTVNSLGTTGTENNKFWFCVSFTNNDAYALAATQMDIGAGLTANEITETTEAWAGTDFTANWKNAVANSQPSDICFTAKNFSSLTNFKLTPMVKANGVTVSGAAL